MEFLFFGLLIAVFAAFLLARRGSYSRGRRGRG
jgi:hypothetical protein